MSVGSDDVLVICKDLQQELLEVIRNREEMLQHVERLLWGLKQQHSKADVLRLAGASTVVLGGVVLFGGAVATACTAGAAWPSVVVGGAITYVGVAGTVAADVLDGMLTLDVLKKGQKLLDADREAVKKFNDKLQYHRANLRLLGGELKGLTFSRGIRMALGGRETRQTLVPSVGERAVTASRYAAKSAIGVGTKVSDIVERVANTRAVGRGIRTGVRAGRGASLTFAFLNAALIPFDIYQLVKSGLQMATGSRFKKEWELERVITDLKLELDMVKSKAFPSDNI